MDLEALGFVWDLERAKYDAYREALDAFEAREGHCRVPRRHREEGA